MFMFGALRSSGDYVLYQDGNIYFIDDIDGDILFYK